MLDPKRLNQETADKIYKLLQDISGRCYCHAAINLLAEIDHVSEDEIRKLASLEFEAEDLDKKA